MLASGPEGERPEGCSKSFPMKFPHRICSRMAVAIAIAGLLPGPSLGGVAAAPTAAEEIRAAGGAGGGSSQRSLELKVERPWSDHGSTHATVSVRNTARFGLAKITVACTAFGPEATARATGEQTLLAPADGPLPPGRTKTIEIVLGTRDREVRSMSCEARAL